MSDVTSTYRQIAQLVAGATSGAVTKTAVAPLERLKILFQVQTMDKANLTNPKYKTIPQALRLVVHEEGWRGLYKGNGANVLRVIPVYALKFSFNDTFRDVVRTSPDQELTMWQMMGAGTLAGLFQQIITYPLEVIRTRLSLGASFGANYSGIVDCTVQSIRHEGVSALYKGVGPTLISGAPYVGLQMTAYELIKRASPKQEDGTVGMGWKLGGGAIAGVAAQTITYPGDTIRRRMQTNGIGGGARLYTTSFQCFTEVIRTEGIRGLFHGLSTNIVRCLPGAAIQFVAYEQMKTLLGV